MAATMLNSAILESYARALRSILEEIQRKQLYRDVDFTYITSSRSSEMFFQNPRITNLLTCLLRIHKHMRVLVENKPHYPIRTESADISFSMIQAPYSDGEQSALSPNIACNPALILEIPASSTSPRTSLALVLVPPALVSQLQVPQLHQGVDFDVQLTFSDLPYLEEALGAIFEISVVVAMHPDIEYLLESESLDEDEELSVEIVKGPSRSYDEAGECWTVSLIVI